MFDVYVCVYVCCICLLYIGTPQIEVTFEIDANSILNVMARELGSGIEQKITITADKGRLSKDEIDRMMNDAEQYQEQDKIAKENIDAKNTLEGNNTTRHTNILIHIHVYIINTFLYTYTYTYTYQRA